MTTCANPTEESLLQKQERWRDVTAAVRRSKSSPKNGCVSNYGASFLQLRVPQPQNLRWSTQMWQRRATLESGAES